METYGRGRAWSWVVSGSLGLRAQTSCILHFFLPFSGRPVIGEAVGDQLSVKKHRNHALVKLFFWTASNRRLRFTFKIRRSIFFVCRTQFVKERYFSESNLQILKFKMTKIDSKFGRWKVRNSKVKKTGHFLTFSSLI